MLYWLNGQKFPEKVFPEELNPVTAAKWTVINSILMSMHLEFDVITVPVGCPNTFVHIVDVKNR